MPKALRTPTISFVNLKGGVGKTALSVNVAFALSEWHAKSVLLIDIDPQFNATQHLLDEEIVIKELAGRTVKDILDPPPPVINVGRPTRKKATKRAPRDFVRAIDIVGEGSLHLLPSLLDLSFGNRNPAGKEGRLERFLHDIQSDYDVILIDCPPTISILTHAAFNASRYYVIPVTPDYFAPIGIPLIEEEVAYFQGNLHAPSGEMKPLGIVYTIVDERWHADWEQVANRVAQATEIPAFSTHFSFSKYWRNCAADHEPVYRRHPHSKQSRQLQEFVDELLERLEFAEAEHI